MTFGSKSVSMINDISKIFKKSAALLLGCFFVLSCENDINEVRSLGAKTTGIEEGKNIESFLSQEGKVKAKLMAPLMLRYQRDTPKVEFPKSLKVDFFNAALQVESKLSAKYGEYKENENKVFLRDSVIVFNVTGDTLFCNELFWDQYKGIFYTEKAVKIHSPTRRFYGTGLVAEQSFKHYTIFKMHNSYMNIPDSTMSGY